MNVEVGGKKVSMKEAFGVIFPETVLKLTQEEFGHVRNMVDAFPELMAEIYFGTRNGDQIGFSDVLRMLKGVAERRLIEMGLAEDEAKFYVSSQPAGGTLGSSPETTGSPRPALA